MNPSRFRRLIGPESLVHALLESLPMADADLEGRIAALLLDARFADRQGAGSDGARPSEGLIGSDSLDAEIRLLRAANRHARAFASLGRPAIPAAVRADSAAGDLLLAVGDRATDALRDLLAGALGPVESPPELRRRDALDDCRERIVREAEARLRSNRDGDLIASAFAPVVAPADADWAASALQELEERSGDAARRFTIGSLDESSRVKTPGWLWTRIRGGVHGKLAAVRGSTRRRRSNVRIVLAAAGLLASTLVYVMVSSRTGPSADRPEIVFQRVDQPLSDQFSTGAVMRRVRDVR